MPAKRRRPEGITIRHAKRCASQAGTEECDCRPGYQAQVYSPRDRRAIRKTFRSLSEARAWRAETQEALRRGTLRAPRRETLAEAAAKWLKVAQTGVIRASAGEPYKPSALRSCFGNPNAPRSHNSGLSGVMTRLSGFTLEEWRSRLPQVGGVRSPREAASLLQRVLQCLSDVLSPARGARGALAWFDQQSPAGARLALPARPGLVP